MYLPSNTPLMQDAQDCAIKGAQASLDRQLCIQTKFAMGRAAVFQDILSPNQIAAQFGVPAGVSAANLQQQTLDSRASAFLYGSGLGASPAEMMVDSPEVFPMGRAGGCMPVQHQMARPKYKKVVPSFPRRAPHIIQSGEGPMYYKGRAATIVSSSQLGLTGYAPPWGNAFVSPQSGDGGGSVMGWIQANPWLSLAIAAGGVLVGSWKGRRR